MANVICVANQKGGIGKTTTAVSIAPILDSLGKKTLLIDADMQCNSTDVYGASTENTATLYDLVIEKNVSAEEAIQHTDYGDIIAADRLLVNAEVELQKDVIGGINRIKNAIEPIMSIYDYIVIDTNPTVNRLLFNCLVAADEIIIPVTADRFGLMGLSQIFETITSVKAGPNPKLTIAGLLLIKFKKQLNLEKDVRDSLKKCAESLNTKVFDTSIRECVKVRESQSLQVPLNKYAPKSSSAQDYRSFVKELIGE